MYVWDLNLSITSHIYQAPSTHMHTPFCGPVFITLASVFNQGKEALYCEEKKAIRHQMDVEIHFIFHTFMSSAIISLLVPTAKQSVHIT